MIVSEQEALQQIAQVLVEDMFSIQKNETVVITVDKASEAAVAKAIFDKVKAAGGLPMLIEIPVGRADSEAGIPDWPVSPLTMALCSADVWIELNSIVLLYSSIWEKAMQENKKLRYLILGDSTPQSLYRILCGFDIQGLGQLLRSIMHMAAAAKKIRVVSQNGTDVSYLTDPTHALDIDDGDYSQPIFGTAPGYVNIVPKVGSMNGRIVFDALQNTAIFEKGETLEFIMKDGSIQEVIGSTEAEAFRQYLAAFNDPNMYKISHHMIGLNPNVRTLVGEVVEDERIWGGTDFGFGHTSPIDMPPHGQAAKSHFDGMIARTTIYFDDIKIIEDGEVCHPDLIPFAEALTKKV